jgi:hypothetical protein
MVGIPPGIGKHVQSLAIAFSQEKRGWGGNWVEQKGAKRLGEKAKGEKGRGHRK